MKNPSNGYWEERAAMRMVDYMAEAEKTANKIGDAYYKASQYINAESKKIFDTFISVYGINEEEALDLILKNPNTRSVKNLLLKLASKTGDVDKRQKIIADISSPAYAYRIKRFEQTLKNTEASCNGLYKTQLTESTEFFKNLVPDAYYRTIFDIQKGLGAAFSFNSMPAARVNKILATDWSGVHFSKSIWGNANKFTEDLRQTLLTSFMTGKSHNKAAREISERYSVEGYKARRIVRTEANYIANQAELDSYRECGIEHYRFIATLDNRTSEKCAELDNKVFNVKNGAPGKNMPPMHPFCRSTTIAVIEGAELDGIQRRAKDPETGKTYLIPADMDYKEWKEKFVDKSKAEEYDKFKEQVHRDIKENYNPRYNTLFKK